MSNSRIRKALESKEKQSKLYETYKKREDLLLNYNTCRAYLKMSGCSVLQVVEAILKRKYNLPWQAKIVRKAIDGVRGERNALIKIEQFRYEEKVYDILSKFVKDHFNEIMDNCQMGDYPLVVKDIKNGYLQ